LYISNQFRLAGLLIRMKKILPLFLAFLLCTSFFQDTESIFLFWKADTKLKWTDFHGHIKPEDEDAASASYIGFYHKIRKYPQPDTVMLDSRAFFNKNRSWVKVPAVNPSLLAHEQLHFDLAELCARNFRKAVLEQQFTSASLSRKIDSTYKYYSAKGDSLHNRYDIETNHGLYNIPQSKWVEQITSQLILLNAYEKPMLKLHLAH
jgi:hypothetical protein